MTYTAAQLIEKLSLVKHPEGGYYHETYRSKDQFEVENLDRYIGSRSVGTSIYFLLNGDEVSKFHRLTSDEIWHYHLGGAAKIHMIDPKGKLKSQVIGKQIDSNQTLQVVIPHGTWFAAEVVQDDFVLVGCTVSPGFEFSDFELANRDHLKKSFPDHSRLIDRFT